MLPKILSVDFVEPAKIWTIRLRKQDGREYEARFTADAFKRVRACPLGQFMLYAWLSRVNAGEAQPVPTR